MRRSWVLIGIALLAAVLAIGAVACDDGDDGDAVDETPPAGATEPADMAEPGVVNVELFEYTVAPDPASVPADSVTFNAENIGGAAHELVVIRTDLDPAQLPTLDDGSVDEEAEGVEVLDRTSELDASGGSESLTVDLEAGSYALVCNIVEDGGLSHYDQGMFTAFEVTE